MPDTASRAPRHLGDYLIVASFGFAAIAALLFADSYLMPRLEMYMEELEVVPRGYWKLESIFGIIDFVYGSFWVIVPIFGLSVALLESFVPGWPRWRWAALASLSVAVNITTLIAFILMTILSLALPQVAELGNDEQPISPATQSPRSQP